MTPFSYERLQLFSADSLFDSGNYTGAIAEYQKIRGQSSNPSYAARAQYKLALTYIYYKNPSTSYSSALEEFKYFATYFPNHENIGIVYTWINILTAFNEYSLQTHDNTLRMRFAEDKEKRSSKEYTTIQDSYLRCDKDRDSLINRIKILEGVMEKLDKIQ
jgi:outer membrane protein assembly factor BamD (BamD/ComL family)